MDPNRYKTSSQMIRLSNALIWFRNQELQRHDLTSSQFEVIRYLLTHREQNITAGLLIEQLELSQSTIAGILKRLETKGLIRRQADAHDGRREFITLTEKGIDLEEDLQEIICQTEMILLRRMSQREQEELYRLLQVALENMNALRPGKAEKSHGA